MVLQQQREKNCNSPRMQNFGLNAKAETKSSMKVSVCVSVLVLATL